MQGLHTGDETYRYFKWDFAAINGRNVLDTEGTGACCHDTRKSLQYKGVVVPLYTEESTKP